MQQQRLLDLGVVEQVAVALGSDLRVVGQHDRRAEDGVVVGASPAPASVLTLSRPASSGETKRPSAILTTMWTEISDSRSAAAHGRARLAPRPCCARSSGTTCRLRSLERSVKRAAGERVHRRPLAGRAPGRARPAARAPRGPRRWAPASATVASSALPRLGDALEPRVIEGARALGRVGRRVDDAERGRGRVLGRAGVYGYSA